QGGEGEEQQAHRHKGPAKGAVHRGEGGGGQGGPGHGPGHRARLDGGQGGPLLVHAGGEDHQGGDGADADGGDEHLEDAPHALLGGVPGVGGGVGDGGGAHAR